MKLKIQISYLSKQLRNIFLILHQVYIDKKKCQFRHK